MKRLFFLAVLAICCLAGCASAPKGPLTLNVMTHDSFAASAPVIAAFEKANNVKVDFLKSGDAGAALNKAILTKDAPLADVFYGVDNTFLSRALDSGIYVPYASPLLAQIPAQFKLDPQNRALPVDYSDVCITYDKAYFAAHALPVPVTLEDLAKPAYKDMLVMENPATSSPGLAFLLATIKHFGTNGYLDYWKSLRANGVVVVDGWETAYYTNFSGSSGHGAATAGGFVCHRSGRGSGQCHHQADRFPGRFDARARHLLPPDRVRWHPERHQAARAWPGNSWISCWASSSRRICRCRCMFTRSIPPPNSRMFLSNITRSRPSRLRLTRRVIASNRDQWIQAWTQAVLH